MPSVMTVHNIAFQGQFPARDLRRARPAAARPSRSTASNITAASATSRPGSHGGRRDHHRQPDLCRRRSARRNSAWASTACSQRRPTCCRHRQRHRHRRLEPGRPTRCSPRTYTAKTLDRPRRQPARGRGALRPRARRRPAALRGQPADLAEGHGHPGRRASTGSSAPGARLAVLGSRRPRRSKARCLPRASRHPRPRRRRHRL